MKKHKTRSLLLLYIYIYIFTTRLFNPGRTIRSNESKKKNLLSCGHCHPYDHRVKPKESKKRDKYLDLAWELKKTMEHESDRDSNFDWRVRYSHQRTARGTGGLGNKRTS